MPIKKDSRPTLPIDPVISERIRYFLEKYISKTQYEAAKVLKISQSSLSMHENNVQPLSGEMTRKLDIQ